MGERAFSVPSFCSNRTDREAPQSVTDPTVNWADCLTQLKPLPPEAGEWREANAFIGAVQRLAQQKHHQREYQHKLQQALGEVATQCTESLLFFGIAARKDLPRQKALLELEGQITQVYEQLSQIFDAAALSQASSPQSSSAGKEDKPVANGALSSTKDLAFPPLLPIPTNI